MTEGKRCKNITGHMQQTQKAHPEAPGTGGQGTLHCRAFQDLFFIEPLPSRVGNVAGFLNTQKQAQIGRQNEKMEKFFLNERTG